jgi:uncharacterized DUF497 family protein
VACRQCIDNSNTSAHNLIVDVTYSLNGVTFRWDEAKARSNLAKHGVTFEQAAQVFFDPYIKHADAGGEDEARDGALGCDFQYRLLFVVHLIFEDDGIRIISARHATASERKRYET